MIHFNKRIIAAINAIKAFKIHAAANRLLRTIAILFSIFLLSGCGGGSDERPCSRSEDVCLIEVPVPEPVDIWWDAPLPDFSDNPDRPTISLLGERTQYLTLGTDYLETGAIAADEQDGDISTDIVISGDVNTSTVGDYFVRYAVTDSSGTVAIEQVRIVRVIDNAAENFSMLSTHMIFIYQEYI